MFSSSALMVYGSPQLSKVGSTFSRSLKTRPVELPKGAAQWFPPLQAPSSLQV